MPASRLPLRSYGGVRAGGARTRRPRGHAVPRDGRNRSRDEARGFGAIRPDTVCRPAIRPVAARKLRRARSPGRRPRGGDRRRRRRRQEPPPARAPPAGHGGGRCRGVEGPMPRVWRRRAIRTVHRDRSWSLAPRTARGRRFRGLWSNESARSIRRSNPYLALYLHLLSVPTRSHPLPRHLQGEHLQAALVDALAALFAVLSKATTLVVFLEDWHWADSASRAVLVRMREVAPMERLLFVVTTRPESSPSDQRQARWPTVVLEPLDFAASAAIIEAGLGAGHVSERLAQHVFERTGGNPFFLEQVCRALVEQGRVSVRDGEAVVEGGLQTLSLPDTVQAVIRSRLDNLEAPAREVARVAAAFGREFEHALLLRRAGAGRRSRVGDRPALGIRPDLSIERASSTGVSLHARADARGQLREPARASAQVHSRGNRPGDRAARPRAPGRTGGAARASLLSRGSMARRRPLRPARRRAGRRPQPVLGCVRHARTTARVAASPSRRRREPAAARRSAAAAGARVRDDGAATPSAGDRRPADRRISRPADPRRGWRRRTSAKATC